MRSWTSRGVQEWSGGKDLYMGSPVLVTGKVSGAIDNIPGPPGGSRGPPGGATGPRGLHGPSVGGEQPQMGWWAPPPGPKAPRRCLPPLGLFISLISWRMGLLGLVPLAHIGQGAHPYSPCGPPGQVAPPGGPPGPFRWSRYNTGDPETCPVTKTGLPIYKSLPPDHSGTPRDVRDLIRDSEQLSVCCILIFIQP